MRTWGFTFLSWYALLAGCTAAPPYQVDTAAPRSLTISSSGASSGPTEYCADGHAVVKEEYGKMSSNGSFPLRKQKKVSLSAEQWNAFWRSVDQFAIERWRSDYTPEGMKVTVTDEAVWRVEMHKNGRVFRCEGKGVYPSPDHPERRTSYRAVLTRLIEIFEEKTSTR